MQVIPPTAFQKLLVRCLLWVFFAGAIAALLVAGFLRSLDGPWGMFPGGPFRGADRACSSAAWTDYAAVEEVEVEVRPERPRSVTTWSVVHEGELFLPADFLTPFKRWPHQVMEDDRIRLRIGGQVFQCRGERVEGEKVIAALRAAAAEKYRLDPSGTAARSEVWWFRVAPR